jgi:hypothetical protein
LLLGEFPRPQLLDRYQLTPFKRLSEAIRGGDLSLFNASLEEFQEFFIRKGIFLILEKLKIFVFRNLVRKVHQYNAKTLTEKQNLLHLTVLQSALRVHGEQMDDDELECLLANLIYNNYLKGYIAHKRCVVVAKVNPFPKLGN